LDNRVRLVGYDINADSFAPGSDIEFTLYWQVVGTLDKDYTVFVHLVDEAETIVGQGDAPPLNNDYPTSYWSRGEELADRHSVLLPSDILPGTYRLYVGFYDPVTGARLSIVDGNGRWEGDAIELGKVRIAEH